MSGTQTDLATTRRGHACLTSASLALIALLAAGCGQSYSTDTNSPSPPGDGAPGGGGGGGVTTSVSVKLEWESPTTNQDQSCLRNLAGYVITYGNTPGAATHQDTVPLNSLSCVDTTLVTACGTVQTCSYTLHGLAPGEWHFTASAYNNDLVTGTASNDAAVATN